MPRTLPVYLDRTEVERLLAAADSDVARLLIRLLWWTGARVSEVLAARVGDITEAGIRLPNRKQHRPWSIAEKHVILPPAALAELKAATAGRRPDEFILARADGRPISRVTAWRMVTRAAARAGLLRRRAWASEARPAWPHTLRHSYAVHLLKERVPITVVQRQLGHRNLSATQVYTQLADYDTTRVMSEVDL
jgi:integrase/recombinase XerD